MTVISCLRTEARASSPLGASNGRRPTFGTYKIDPEDLWIWPWASAELSRCHTLMRSG